jgi:hypothetical protein
MAHHTFSHVLIIITYIQSFDSPLLPGLIGKNIEVQKAIKASIETSEIPFNAMTLDTNICWRLGWSEAEIPLQRDKRRYFVRLVVKDGWWNSENGYLKRC